MTAYYNEIDPYAAQWLRNLIEAGHIAFGVVDERSIEDVRPDEIRGYTQCHFFAGIGVWSLALRDAGWRDDQRVWTASLPCQPFSAAGKQLGFEDERHLWPVFERLVAQSDVPVCFGEQVASKAVNEWLDVVLADLETLGFSVGAIAYPSAGVGAPHIRDRTYWCAARPGALRDATAQWLADAHGRQCNGQSVIRGSESHRADAGRPQGLGEPQSHGDVRGLADAESERRDGGQDTARPRGWSCIEADSPVDGVDSGGRPGPVNGLWSDADWLFCRDEKWRPVEPGTFPLADGAPARVGRLRAYGNAINTEAARVWIETVMDCLP